MTLDAIVMFIVRCTAALRLIPTKPRTFARSGSDASICWVISCASLWDGMRTVAYAWTTDSRLVGCWRPEDQAHSDT